MRFAIANMWPTLQASCRHVAQVIAKERDGKVQTPGLPETVTAAISDKAGSQASTEEAILRIVTLGHINDSLWCVSIPMVPYVRAGGLLAHLNTTTIIPFLKPAANYYARNLAPYFRLTALGRREFPALFWTYALDQGEYGLQNTDTTFAGLRTLSVAAYLSRDKTLFMEYTQGVLLSLFDKSVRIAGTVAESAESRNTLTHLLDFAESWCDVATGDWPEMPARPVLPARTPTHQRLTAPTYTPPPPPLPVPREPVASVHTLTVKITGATVPPPGDLTSMRGNIAPKDQTDLPAVVGAPVPSRAVLDDARAELRGVIGLSGVKEEVERLVNFLKVQAERRRHGLRESGQSLHFVFTGNPGTGKTTVARILAKVLHGLGVIKTANVVECDRSGLVGSFLGETANKTDAVVKAALDGILFIDEAYALAGDTDKYGYGDRYGDEAINTLLKRMEDYRDRLVVIVAGYPALMENFLRTNPGLESRFTRFIRFEDYRTPDLCRIFEKFCNDAEYTLTTLTRAYAYCLFAAAHRGRDERFGNGRFVRNLYERTVSRHADRVVAKSAVPDKTDLVTLAALDIPPDWPSHFDPGTMDLGESLWVGGCPGCKQTRRCGVAFLGQVVKCKCGGRFVFPWWNPVSASLQGVPPDWVEAPNQDDLYGQPV